MEENIMMYQNSDKNIPKTHAEFLRCNLDALATGQQIRYYRRLRNLTQEELSGIFTDFDYRISRNTISNWETGKKSLSLESAMLLAGILGCDVGELLISYRQAAKSCGRG